MQEGGKIAFEACFLHHRNHLGVELGNFGEADLVDRLGRGVEGREFQDLRAIVSLAVGQHLGGQRRAGVRDVFVVPEFQQVRIGRLRGGDDHL